MEKAAGKGQDHDETVEDREKTPPSPRDPVPRKRKRKRKRAAAIDGAASDPGLCDDVLINVFARLPARAVVAFMSLSKHHHALIRSPEFRSLHFRLAPPLPRPHIAYLATAPIKRRPQQEKPVSVFHGFHVAGAGIRGTMRSLSGWRYLEMSYINTCNGVVLLARKDFSRPCRCVLWNPAVADGVEGVTVPYPWERKEYQVLGLGYGRRTKTYKLLLCRKDRYGGYEHYSPAIYSLGDADKEQRRPTRLATTLSAEVLDRALYADGKIYLLQRPGTGIVAFDVDDEVITSIDLPTSVPRAGFFFKLMELSGRPCIAVEDDSGSKALWVLSPDHQWVMRCRIAEQRRYEDNVHLYQVTGVWDCGGVLLLYSMDAASADKLFVYNVATGKMFETTLHRDLAPDSSEYAICWGYRPTLLSPGSIIGKLDVEGRRRELPADMTKALQPVVERDRKQGHEATADTVSLMDVLVCIMRRLPDGVQELQDLLKMLTA